MREGRRKRETASWAASALMRGGTPERPRGDNVEQLRQSEAEPRPPAENRNSLACKTSSLPSLACTGASGLQPISDLVDIAQLVPLSTVRMVGCTA